MIKNKKKILTRILATAFAVAFAVLPLGLFSSEKNKVTASAEDFEQTITNNSPLVNPDAFLNPYSFFDFSIRRPADDWSGTYDNDSLDVYGFSLPQYLSNTNFLRSVGIDSTSSVFNYMPLYSGSMNMTFNNSYPCWYFLNASFPSPLKGLYIGEWGETAQVSTFRMEIVEKLIPYNSFLTIMSLHNVENSTFQFMANAVDYYLDIVYLDETSKEPFEVKHYKKDIFGLENISIVNDFSSFFDDRFGLNADNIDNYIYSSTIKGFYIKQLYIEFYYVADWANAKTAFNSFVRFQLHMPSTADLVDKKGSYQRLLQDFSNIVGKTNYVSISPANSIFAVVTEFFDMELFPGFKMSYLLYVSIAGLVIGFAIKIFLQG